MRNPVWVFRMMRLAREERRGDPMLRESLNPVSNLKLLARSLGLSITTVSRALDGYSDVAPATRERVQAAAQAMNYRPNPAARSLRRRRAEAVAVTLLTEPGRFGPPIFLNMLAACGQRLAEEGLDLMLLPTAGRAGEMDTYRRLLDGRRADAVIVVRTRLEDERVAFLKERGIPFITHGRTALRRISHLPICAAKAGWRPSTISSPRTGSNTPHSRRKPAATRPRNGCFSRMHHPPLSCARPTAWRSAP